MKTELRGQTVVIAGGASGIGKAIAEAFAGEGAGVALFDIAEGVHEIAVEIARTYGVCTLGITLDITNSAEVLKAADSVEAALGPCNHVVVAAGKGSGKLGFPFWNLTPEDWLPVLNINLLGVVNCAHTFAPRLAEQRSGTMLFIASIAGQIGSQTDPPYSAAKAGVINFAQCAAKDLAPYDVRVNTICPGMVQTPLNRSVWKAWNDRQAVEDQLSYEAWGTAKVRQVAPLGKWQTPEEIASLAVFLATDHARNITGQTLNIDGGQVMHS